MDLRVQSAPRQRRQCQQDLLSVICKEMKTSSAHVGHPLGAFEELLEAWDNSPCSARSVGTSSPQHWAKLGPRSTSLMDAFLTCKLMKGCLSSPTFPLISLFNRQGHTSAHHKWIAKKKWMSPGPSWFRSSIVSNTLAPQMRFKLACRGAISWCLQAISTIYQAMARLHLDR